ncbi:subtilisin-like protein [Lactarius quietus]|nr:subtilisin-like protein [Lactarius quietus]
MRYHCIFVLSALEAILLGSFAAPLSSPWDDMYTKHSWDTVPKNWESLGSPPSGNTTDYYIELKPHRENALIDALYELTHVLTSPPVRCRYGMHLSKQQVAELVAPRPDTLELVHTWLERHGVPSSGSSVSMTHGGNTLKLKGVSVTQVNTLLNASYRLYRHIESGETVVRTISYALPVALQGHVLSVTPTTSFPTDWRTPRNRSGKAAAGEVKSESASKWPPVGLSGRYDVNYVTPSYLHWLYDSAAYVPTAADRNMLGIVGFLGDYPSPTDLTAFMRQYRPDAVSATYTVVPVNGGGYDPSNPHTESNLNIQYAEAMVYPTPVIYYSVGQGTSEEDDWFSSWFEYILDQEIIPQTIVMTYGYDEIDLSVEYAVKMCILFAQLGARGVSVLVTSGNNGVGKENCVVDGFVRFRPTFPSTCPHVTAVGGTTGFTPEVAAELSGGGFSDYFLRPDYQDEEVPAYLQKHGNRNRDFYNPNGRGIPDIAAQAEKFRFIFEGNVIQNSGTSFAAPVAAGIISLLNDWLISHTGMPIGFLNPWLYSSGFLGLIDVTSGSNPGCLTKGFSASVGWDPVTGLGTPGFTSLQQAILLVLEQHPVGRGESLVTPHNISL